jgi:DNA-directed RNA polymerase II subunit RPB2
MNEKTWDVIDAYFGNDANFLTKHHLDSYNDFVYTKIQNTIRSLNPFVILKNNKQTKKIQHEIQVFVGGKDAQDIFFEKPNLQGTLLLPNEARLKNATYAADIVCNILIRYVVYKGDKKTEFDQLVENIKIGSIPIMLQSKLCVLYQQPKHIMKEMGECAYDQGGYMIVDGKEKVIIAQERIATNRLFINRSKDDNYSFEGLIRCTTEEAAVFPKTLRVSVYSSKPSKGKRNNAIVLQIPTIKREIPLFVLFRALGIQSDKSIMEHIVYDMDDPGNSQVKDFLYYSMRDGAFLYTQQQAISFLAEFVEHKDTEYVKFVLMNDLFPNMNEGHGDALKISLTKKAMFLGHVANHIVKVCVGMEKPTDRDHYASKRVDLSGFLMANLFRDFYNLFRNHARSAIDRIYNYSSWKDDDITTLVNPATRWEIFNSNIIENGFTKSLKGKWGIDGDPAKAGNVQDLSRITYIGFISHLRRVNTPIDRSIKVVEPRRLHSTQWGYMCPCESPDGGSIGLLKNFAMLCHVSFDCSSTEIVRCLKDLGVVLLEQLQPGSCTGDVAKVLVNSNWVGLTREPDVVVRKLRLLRRNALINVMTSVSWNIVGKEININTEAGRCCRPLYIVKKNNALAIEPVIDQVRKGTLSWTDMLRGKTRSQFSFTDCAYYPPSGFFPDNGKDKETVDVWARLKENQAVVELVDVEESGTCMVAMDFDALKTDLPRYTHCELHPSTMFAVLTANIPFAHHNQAPRNYFSGQQGKQSVSVYNTAFNSRMDTMSFVLHYSQRSLVNTRYMRYLGNDALPHGTNTIVAIMTYSGLTSC